jgi:hypothetical protein
MSLEALPATARAGDSGSPEMPLRGTTVDPCGQGRYGPTDLKETKDENEKTN